jgi:hypothetical protein
LSARETISLISAEADKLLRVEHSDAERPLMLDDIAASNGLSGPARTDRPRHSMSATAKASPTTTPHPAGDDCEQQMPRQVSWRRPLQHAPPSYAKPVETETAQMRHLVLNGRLAGGTTIAALLSHRLTSSALRDPPIAGFCELGACLHRGYPHMD